MSSKVSAFGAKAPPRFIKIDLKSQDGPQAAMSAEQEQLLKSFMLQSVHLDASLNEFASHGSLTFIFKNPVATPVEMLFAFPLMDGGAVITGITTEWDGHRITGRVRESEQGKKEYSEAIAEGRTASLVQHAENDLFMWRVGGIPGGCTVTVVTQFCGPVVMTKRFGKKPMTEITLTVPAVVPPWYGKADVGDAALAFDTAVQAPASSIGGLALALPPFTATVRSHFITKSLRAVTVTSPTHGPPDASSIRTSDDGLEVTFRDLFKSPAGSEAATNLQMRWVADGIVPNMACLGRMLAGAGQLTAASSGTDSAVSQDAAAVEAMEAAAAALAVGPLAADALALLNKTKTQQRQVEQVCGVMFSEHDGKQPEGIHVTVLVDCSGSMYPNRIDKARKAVRALLTSLHPSSTFAVYLFGSSCKPVVLEDSRETVYIATPQNVKAVADKVYSDTSGSSMGGTELCAAVQTVMSGGVHVPVGRRHNVMILTDGEVGQDESGRVKQMLVDVCPGQALVGVIGIGYEVTRATLRTIVEGGLGPHAILFDSESDESIANIVLGSIDALVSSQLRQVNWPGGKMFGSQPHVQCNSSEVCAAWALYPEAQPSPATPASEDEEWEIVAADDHASDTADELSGCSAPPLVRWLGGASVTVAASQASHPAVQLPTLLVTNEDVIKSMCVAAALTRCRHASCSRQEATKLALRYGFVCAEADSVMVAISDQATSNPLTASSSFGVAIPSQPARPPQPARPRVPAAPQRPFTASGRGGSQKCYSGARGRGFSLLGPSSSHTAPSRAGGRRGPVLAREGQSYGNVRRYMGDRRCEVELVSGAVVDCRLGHNIGRVHTGNLVLVDMRDHDESHKHTWRGEICINYSDQEVLALSRAGVLPKRFAAERDTSSVSFVEQLGDCFMPETPSNSWTELTLASDEEEEQQEAISASAVFSRARVDVGGGVGSMSHSRAPPQPFVGDSSLLDVLGAMDSASWSVSDPVVVNFLARHLPQAAKICASNAHVTVAVIVVLRAKFKHAKKGWHAHVKRAAQAARCALGEVEYASCKAMLVRALHAAF